MRYKEQRLWDRMKSRIPARVRAERIENGLSTGMPDVLVLAAGLVTWCELKAIPQWPAREHTSVLGNTDGLNQDQRNWHFDWQQHGGRSCVIVAVDLETFLFNMNLDALNGYTKVEFYKNARCVGWESILLYLQKA